MKCCFSGQETPTSKLFLLYYPPTMAHEKWDKSVYAAARAGEALRETVQRLRTFFWRYVVGPKLVAGIAVGLIGFALFAHWLDIAGNAWQEAGFFQRYLQPFLALMLVSFGAFRLRRFLRRFRVWRQEGRGTVAREIEAIEKEIATIGDEDPTAEQAAAVMRRRCPEVISQLAFHGTYFHAFTYMDFVLYPHLKHPSSREELPRDHSLSRDAYYVGDVVYDHWRLFHKDDRELEDPRFAGSGGRRGVI